MGKIGNRHGRSTRRLWAVMAHGIERRGHARWGGPSANARREENRIRFKEAHKNRENADRPSRDSLELHPGESERARTAAEAVDGRCPSVTRPFIHGFE